MALLSQFILSSPVETVTDQKLKKSLRNDYLTEKVFIQELNSIPDIPIKNHWNLIICIEDYSYTAFNQIMKF